MEERKSSYNKKNIVYEKDIQKFGSITLVIQDGRIVQIEKNEKVRIK